MLVTVLHNHFDTSIQLNQVICLLFPNAKLQHQISKRHVRFSKRLSSWSRHNEITLLMTIAVFHSKSSALMVKPYYGHQFLTIIIIARYNSALF